MYLVDAGTLWAKVLNVETGERFVKPVMEVAGRIKAVAATGHNAKLFSENVVNEVVALVAGLGGLVKGGHKVVCDVGSRDTKCIFLEDGVVKDIRWNSSCGASQGFSIEVLAKIAGVDLSGKGIPVPEGMIGAVCGLLGMVKFFDLVSEGERPDKAFAKFVKGIAFNVWTLAGKPEEIILSGGLTENELFVRCLSTWCKVISVGRFVQVEGLYAISKKRGWLK